MTNNYHTPIPEGAPANAQTFNDPMAEFDQALTEALLTEKDGHIIQDEGVDLAQQPRLDFVGSGVTVTNEAGKTKVTIPSTDTSNLLAKTGLTEWDEQGSNPSTPAANKWKLYFKPDGLYLIDDTGTVVGPIDIRNYLAKTGLTEWDEQGINPSTPAANKWKVFFKADGLYIIDDAGVVTGPIGTGGGGLTVSSASVTTSNVTGVEGTLHNLDVSGMTANRDFNLPTPSAAGKRIGVRLSTGDDTYALILKINAVEWSRIFISNEIVIFVSTGTNAGDWAIESDSRIPQTAQMRSTVAQSISTGVLTQATFDSEVYDVGDIASISTERMTVRRAGRYVITASYNIPIVDAKRALVVIYRNGSGLAGASLHGSHSSNLGPFASVIADAAAGDYFELYLLQDTGSSQNTVVSNDNSMPRLSIAEVL